MKKLTLNKMKQLNKRKLYEELNKLDPKDERFDEVLTMLGKLYNLKEEDNSRLNINTIVKGTTTLLAAVLTVGGVVIRLKK